MSTLLSTNRSIQRYLINLTPIATTVYSLWKATNNLNGPQQAIPPYKKSKRLNQMRQLLNSHLHNGNKFSSQSFLMLILRMMEKLINNYPMNIFPRKIAVRGIKYIIVNRINRKEAPGYEVITGKTLLKLSENDRSIHKTYLTLQSGLTIIQDRPKINGAKT